MRESGARQSVKIVGLPRSLWDTYSAFANCRGGVIILRVKEKADGSWKTTGLTNEAALLKDFWNTINNPGKVSAYLLSDEDVDTHTMPNGDVILTIHVPRAKRELKPIFVERDMYSGTFRRNGEGDYHCTKSEVRAMVRDSFDETLDAQVVESQRLLLPHQQEAGARPEGALQVGRHLPRG